MRKALILCFGVIGLTAQTLRAQDPQYSLFFANPLYQNPAHTGGDERHRFSITYRKQWFGLESHFNTYSAAFDTYLYNAKARVKTTGWGIGGLLYHDRQGPNLQNTAGYLSAAPHIHLDSRRKIKFIPAIQVGVVSYALDAQSLLYVATLSGVNEPLTQLSNGISSTSFDTGTGILLEAVNDTNDGLLQVGFGAKHLLRGVSLNQWLTPALTTHASATFPIDMRFMHHGRDLGNDYQAIELRAQWRKQGPAVQWDAGANLIYFPFTAGAYLRGVPDKFRTDAISLVAGFYSNDYRFMLLLGYDLTVSSLAQRNTQGALELNLSYRFDSEWGFNVAGNTHRRRLKCPKY
jgi:type IX secretion system PorP/SprF family membrane protein